MSKDTIMHGARAPHTVRTESGSGNKTAASGSGSSTQHGIHKATRIRQHEAAMSAHIAQQAMAATIAAGATTEEAIAAGQSASDAVTGVNGSTTMQD